MTQKSVAISTLGAKDFERTEILSYVTKDMG
jgi:hypothetical protein